MTMVMSTFPLLDLNILTWAPRDSRNSNFSTRALSVVTKSVFTPTILAVGGTPSKLSTTTRRGNLLTLPTLGVRSGSSASTVPIPVMIASTCFLNLWTRSLEASEVIHLDSLCLVAVFPSRDAAIFNITKGLPVVTLFIQPSLSFRHSASSTPVSTSIPAFLSISKPLPETFGFGSVIPATTLFFPAFITASVQGGVLPKWQHGSRFRYSVPPLAALPASFSALTSAWAPPDILWYPCPTILPFLTTTAPTIGLGDAPSIPFLA